MRIATSLFCILVGSMAVQATEEGSPDGGYGGYGWRYRNRQRPTDAVECTNGEHLGQSRSRKTVADFQSPSRSLDPEGVSHRDHLPRHVDHVHVHGHDDKPSALVNLALEHHHDPLASADWCAYGRTVHPHKVVLRLHLLR